VIGGEEAELSERKWYKTEGGCGRELHRQFTPPKCAIISLEVQLSFRLSIRIQRHRQAQQIIFRYTVENALNQQIKRSVQTDKKARP